MIDPEKLRYLQGGQKRRKLALCLGALERDILGVAEAGHEYAFRTLPRAVYLKKIISIIFADPSLPPAAAQEIAAALGAEPFAELRACNLARNHLLALVGTFPAEWDLIVTPHRTADSANPAGEARALPHAGLVAERPFVPGIMAYAEDIRSPFNLGSIFRTAEAFGVEKLFLSPFCCPAEHPRALRSAMGATSMMNYERKTLAELPDVPVFALETGGTPLGAFPFPKRGIMVVGSEELGVSPDALKRATAGRVAIPLVGLKASLNVGAAFAVAVHAWLAQAFGETERPSQPKNSA
ncbi:TrmH family RNA methyltransferase [Treponema endosymbiont of Eucomonympha sp.]|uniref:TrmH family RNA methyltransferase n=1 Tax=Treponema endosymbiont of Eucomonympha sp. TaxID=1580831 RepID=UPI000785D9B2|nr:TrmH family RNA methyltransferase [Treponema endosymbiont of Eucomonympha sp.]